MSDLESCLSLIRQDIRDLSAYHVQDASDFIKLDAMENPYQWSDALKQEWLQVLSSAEINRYPDPAARPLANALRPLMNVPEHADVMFGNGSDELIQIIMMALAKPNATVMSVEPSFVMYRMIAKYLNINYVGIDLNLDFSLDLVATVAAIKQHQPAVIFLAQPNNPTANVYSDEQISAIVEASTGFVVMDEAYMAFTDSDFMSWINKHPKVLVMRTLSKMGLAGLRFGMLFAHADLIAEFDKVRLPYNINVLTQLSVEFALKHFDVLVEQTDELCKQRAELYQALNKLDDVEVFPSEANFLLIRVAKDTALEVFERIKQQGILVKCMHGGHPHMSDMLRLTIGTSEQNALLLEAIKKAL